MQIEYKNKKLEKLCTNAAYAEKKYSYMMAEKIQQRIGEITAADSVEDLILYQIGGCHKLKGDRKGQYAMNLFQSWRLCFKKKGEQIQIITIWEIVDYH